LTVDSSLITNHGSQLTTDNRQPTSGVSIFVVTK